MARGCRSIVGSDVGMEVVVMRSVVDVGCLKTIRARDYRRTRKGSGNVNYGEM